MSNERKLHLIIGALVLALAASAGWGYVSSASVKTQLAELQQKDSAQGEEIQKLQDQLKAAQEAATAASQAGADAKACQASLKARDEQLQAFALQAASCETVKRRLGVK